MFIYADTQAELDAAKDLVYAVNDLKATESEADLMLISAFEDEQDDSVESSDDSDSEAEREELRDIEINDPLPGLDL